MIVAALGWFSLFIFVLIFALALISHRAAKRHCARWGHKWMIDPVDGSLICSRFGCGKRSDEEAL
jgi:ABC-type microcin C transport system permease subunit YejE